MRVKVLFFGPLADEMGEREAVCEMPSGARLADLRRHYENLRPALTAWRGHIQISVNREIQNDALQLAEGDEIAFLPPASGG